jgi:hypothetical protein
VAKFPERDFYPFAKTKKGEQAEKTTPAEKDKARSTMAIMLSALERSHEQAIETVAEQSSVNSRRMWLVILLVICVLAAVIGVTTSIELPGVTIGAGE